MDKTIYKTYYEIRKDSIEIPLAIWRSRNQRRSQYQSWTEQEIIIMKKLKEAMLQIPGGEIPITLLQSGDTYRIEVDGVLWMKTTNVTHAVVMFTMMQEHICEYVHYQKREDSK